MFSDSAGDQSRSVECSHSCGPVDRHFSARSRYSHGLNGVGVSPGHVASPSGRGSASAATLVNQPCVSIRSIARSTRACTGRSAFLWKHSRRDNDPIAVQVDDASIDVRRASNRGCVPEITRDCAVSGGYNAPIRCRRPRRRGCGEDLGHEDGRVPGAKVLRRDVLPHHGLDVSIDRAFWQRGMKEVRPGLGRRAG